MAETGRSDKRLTLTTLWVFVTLNYVYADVVNLFDKAGTFKLSQIFLLAASILVEVPISMVLLSRVLKYRASRWACIIAGGFMSIVQIATLFVGTPTYYYVFFSVIEIATTAFIVWYAWRWEEPVPSHNDPPAAASA